MRLLVAAGLFLGSSLLQAENAYRVRLPDGRVVSLSAEEYVAAAVSGEAGTLKSVEAQKAMAVVARTFAFRMAGRHRAEGFDFCSTTHCQRILPAAKNEKALMAQRATEGQILWWNGSPALTIYSQDCGGRAESANVVWPEMAAPYLHVHDDPYCMRHGQREWTWSVDWHEMANALLAEHLRVPDSLAGLEITARTGSGRAKVLRLKGTSPVLISASSLRFAIGRHMGWNLVRSDRYEVSGNCLRGRGQGHGVGLCQVGAEEMGEEGLDYRAILRFYYPGTAGPSRAAKGFEWTRLGGERVTIFTVQRNRDAGLPGEAERALQWAEGRVHERLGRRLGIRMYPDVAAFRDATGEPGWVAARYREGRIDMQPKADLVPVLRHEMLHAVLEEHASPTLPAWFREGLVGVLCGDAATSVSGEVRDRTDKDLARGGYGDVRRRVRALMNRFGEATVLGWVTTGIPSEYEKDGP